MRTQKDRTPLRIGLTGGIGAGKTTVANLFESLGTPVLSADEAARAVVRPGSPLLKDIEQAFGSTALKANGEFDREAMRQRVFKDRDARLKLEAITHPAIRKHILRQTLALDAPYVIIEIPLLVESGGVIPVDRVLVVESDPHERMRRVRKRDGLADSDILAIMDAQASDQQRREAAHDIIVNNDDVAALETQVRRLHDVYLSLTRRR